MKLTAISTLPRRALAAAPRPARRRSRPAALRTLRRRLGQQRRGPHGAQQARSAGRAASTSSSTTPQPARCRSRPAVLGRLPRPLPGRLGARQAGSAQRAASEGTVGGTTVIPACGWPAARRAPPRRALAAAPRPAHSRSALRCLGVAEGQPHSARCLAGLGHQHHRPHGEQQAGAAPPTPAWRAPGQQRLARAWSAAPRPARRAGRRRSELCLAGLNNSAAPRPAQRANWQRLSSCLGGPLCQPRGPRSTQHAGSVRHAAAQSLLSGSTARAARTRPEARDWPPRRAAPRQARRGPGRGSTPCAARSLLAAFGALLQTAGSAAPRPARRAPGGQRTACCLGGQLRAQHAGSARHAASVPSDPQLRGQRGAKPAGSVRHAASVTTARRPPSSLAALGALPRRPRPLPPQS